MISGLYVGERSQQFNNHLSLNNLLSSQTSNPRKAPRYHTIRYDTKRSEEDERHTEISLRQEAKHGWDLEMGKKSIGNRMSGYGSTVNTNANAMSASLKRFLISCAVDKNALKTKLTEPKRTETNNRQKKKKTERSRSEKDRAERERAKWTGKKIRTQQKIRIGIGNGWWSVRDRFIKLKAAINW